tara:strand:- start:2708 stop:2926 length:219 start_codon:yes stop_codon:yes gene_type:complete
MDSKQEGNLVSFRLFITTDGSIISEYKYLPERNIKKIFSSKESYIIEKIVREGRLKLEPLHDFIEKEVQSII